ncbi:MAG TPA: isoamylase early set domain-containing protein [Gemmatimonadaceae bacterium]|nr:isoamylase early set domain-containing protein [Gemmatimonadaceae bacterium]
MTDEQDRNHDDDVFARKVAQPLREPEVLDQEFERRVMGAVQAEPTISSARPWQRPLEVSVAPLRLSFTPLRALAVAASFGGLIVLGTLGATGWFSRVDGAQSVATAAAVSATSGVSTSTTASGAPAGVDTVHLVRFVLVAPEAHDVALVGDFNSWSREATRLVPTGDAGVWSVSVPLQPGRHEYAFVVDGEQWVADPTTPRHVDEFGTESSVLRVGRDIVRGV